MTKREAINLESECEKLLSDALGKECVFGITLVGNFSVSFENSFIQISKRDFHTPYYFKFHGYYEEFEEILEKIQKVFSGNKEKFRMLLESYHMNLDD